MIQDIPNWREGGDSTEQFEISYEEGKVNKMDYNEVAKTPKLKNQGQRIEKHRECLAALHHLSVQRSMAPGRMPSEKFHPMGKRRAGEPQQASLL